ncbi:MAG: ABC transporter permease [Bacteroidia bacterium]|nr:ABC transporter permease [Bacteroidia bacterium]
MTKKLLIKISKALLLARWKQTLVAAIGVTFSIAMFISLLGFMGGLNNLLDGLMLNRTAHIRLYNDIEPSAKQPVELSEHFKHHYNFVSSVKPKKEQLNIYNSAAIMRNLKKDERVKGVAPKINTQVFFNVGVVDLNGMISGIDVDEESELFLFKDYVVKGNYHDLKTIPNSIILGKGAADKMLAQLGDNITLTTTQGNQFQLKVVGFYQSGIQELDKVQSYASIATAQKLLGESDLYITDIQIKLKDMNLAPAMAREFRRLYKTEAMDIQTANAQFETGSFVRTLISYAVGITLLIVAGFGIYNILNMMIYEKIDSIAILKATGFSGKDVNKIFTSIALSIGAFGGLLGLIFGLVFSLLIDLIPFNTASLPTVTTYPVDYNLYYYIIGAVFSVATTYLAGYFPSRKAATVDPVVIIRGK